MVAITSAQLETLFSAVTELCTSVRDARTVTALKKLATQYKQAKESDHRAIQEASTHHAQLLAKETSFRDVWYNSSQQHEARLAFSLVNWL
jgi:uncharacterized protein YoxC